MIDGQTYEGRMAELAEYERRLVPASDAEIVGLAEILWSDSALRRIFERVGFDGDFDDAEQEAVDAAIDGYRQGDLWDRDQLHLALAPCLLRQRAAGMIDRFDGPEAIAFIADRRVKRNGAGMSGVSATADESMTFARMMRADPACWKVIQRLSKDPNQLVREGDPEGVIGRFQTRYRFKYGFLNRSAFGGAISMLRGLADGSIPDIDSPHAWEVIRNSRFVKDGPVGRA